MRVTFRTRTFQEQTHQQHERQRRLPRRGIDPGPDADDPAGAPGRRQPEHADGRQRRADNDRELPAAGEDHALRLTYYVDQGPNPHVNHEPSRVGGLVEAGPAGEPHEPHCDAKLVREPIDRPNDFAQAGQTYRDFEPWEQDELVNNLGHNPAQCQKDIRAAIIDPVTRADAEYGRRVVEMLRKHEAAMAAVRKPHPMATAPEMATAGA